MKPIYTKNRTIGLLGGSFNPAHSGHLHISLHALKNLGMDEIWWLVSPQNPLKSKDMLEEYQLRLDSAKAMAQHRNIHVSDIESKLNTRYTYETIRELKRLYPATHFVWLMGADNLEQFHRWQRWQALLDIVPVVVFDRAPYSFTSLASKSYLRMRRFLLKNTDSLPQTPAPALRFVHLRRDTISSTFLRKTLGKKAFLSHTKTHRTN